MSRQLIPVISLFSGPGGMDLGFRKQGFLPIVAIDISQSAVETYNWNAKKRIAQQQDLSKLSDGDIVRLIRDAAPGIKPCGVIGGPPCQSFSLSNVHKKRNDPRRKLPLRYAEILKALNQEFNLDFFVFENVTGLKSNKHSKYFRKILKAFEDAGFEVFEQELDARKFGVAQKRRRVFVVGINKSLYPNLKFEFPMGDGEKVITVKDVIGKLPKPAFFRRNIARKEIPRHPNHWTMNPKSAKFKNGPNQNGRSFRRLKWNEPSWTVAYGHREIHIHPGGKRRVSLFEAMLLQGFPQSYELRGNLTQQVTQVSDAVPPPLAGAVAKAIKKAIYKRVESIQSHLLDWFKKNQRSFPWRETRDPYKVLLAEKLLQQTAAREKVVAAYNEIVDLYPNVEALAMAQPGQLKPIIAPLGFAYRAEELPRLAHEILNRDHSEIPTTLNELLDLPGIGDYSARAVLAFAHNQDVPIVDTNVTRFLYRIYGITEPLPNNPARNKRLIEMAQTLIPEGNARDFNLAVLDLCSSVCKIKNPTCDKCPVQSYCLSRNLKLEDKPNTETICFDKKILEVR
jgi:DNA (cytosine-5)-methyltransferase 1